METRTTFKLSNRKIEVMKFIAEGLAQKEVAAKMNLSYDTIQAHVYQSLRRTNCRNATELVYKLTKAGLI